MGVARGKGWGGWVWWGGWVGGVVVRIDVWAGGCRVGGWLNGWVVVGGECGEEEGRDSQIHGGHSGSGIRVVPAGFLQPSSQLLCLHIRIDSIKTKNI